MRRCGVLIAAVLIIWASVGTIPLSAQAPIESELVLITPVSKFVVDASLSAFTEYAKQKWGVTVKASATHEGTPTCYGKIVEWKGRPQADIFWGGESALFDSLADQKLLVKLDLPRGTWESVAPSIGEPVRLPMKDPRGFWVGTALEPYGLVWHPKLLKRLGVDDIKDWDDLLNPKLKGWIAQCTPDRSSSNHASYEVILQMYGLEKGWEWLEKLAANTGQFVARSRDVPSVVAKGEYAVGFAVPSYMAFEEVVAGYDLRFVAPTACFVTPEPMAILAGCKNPKAAKAFVEFLLTEQGQRVFMERGLFSVSPKYRVEGAPGSIVEKAVEFTGGIRSYFDAPIRNIYDDKVAQERYSEVNDVFRKRILERHEELKKKY
ncbi:MAG: extracellular solute-binding protein [Clostridia bacterium]